MRPAKRTWILLGIVALVLLGRFVLYRPLDAETAPLTLHLRCGGDEAAASGRLSVTIGVNVPRGYDLKPACAVGRIDFKDYRGSEGVRLRLERDGKSVADLETTPDRDQHGYHAIVKISATPPFLGAGKL